MMNHLIDWNKLPLCLKRPLVFGDTQQIQALKDMEAKAEEQERLEAELESGEVNEYWVSVSWSGEASLRILAESRFDAERIAREDPPEPEEMEIEYVYAKLIKKDEAPSHRSFEMPLFKQQ